MDTPKSLQEQLNWLCTLLEHLPQADSLPDTSESSKTLYPFTKFSVSADLIERTGDELGGVNETFKGILMFHVCLI